MFVCVGVRKIKCKRLMGNSRPVWSGQYDQGGQVKCPPKYSMIDGEGGSQQILGVVSLYLLRTWTASKIPKILADPCRQREREMAVIVACLQCPRSVHSIHLYQLKSLVCIYMFFAPSPNMAYYSSMSFVEYSHLLSIKSTLLYIAEITYK